MPGSVSVNAIATADAAPTTAPHRISSKTGKNTLTVNVVGTHDGVYYPSSKLIPPFTPGVAAPVLAIIMRDGGIDPYSGTLVGRKGLVCSDSEPCSDSSLACSDWEAASGTNTAEDVTYPELAAPGTPSEGSHAINVYCAFNGQGFV